MPNIHRDSAIPQNNDEHRMAEPTVPNHHQKTKVYLRHKLATSLNTPDSLFVSCRGQYASIQFRMQRTLILLPPGSVQRLS